MQNQVALYLIFATGVILIIGSIIDSDYLFGLKRTNQEIASLPRISGFFSKILNTIARMFSVLPNKSGNEIDLQRRNKRVLFVIFGLLIIVLGIIALNSGKFS